MKLFADINISTRVVAGLRALGHDIERMDRFLSPTADDTAIAAFVDREGGALITRDQDFSAILAMSGASGPSIVNLRHSRTDSPFLVGLLDAVLRSHEADLRAAAIVTIDDGGVRVHPLPIA